MEKFKKYTNFIATEITVGIVIWIYISFLGKFYRYYPINNLSQAIVWFIMNVACLYANGLLWFRVYPNMDKINFYIHMLRMLGMPIVMMWRLGNAINWINEWISKYS